MILLDTHVAIWLLMDPLRLSGPARDAILKARVEGENIGCSAVSFYEIANAARRKRLELYSTTKDFIASVQTKVDLIPLTAAIAICAAELPAPFHGDPMDRIITATAIVENCALVTHDHRIRSANVCKTIW